MAKPTISEIFGTGAARLASGASAPSAGLFIPDSALIAAGLTTPSTATAEGHLTAIILKAETVLTQTAFGTNTDQSIYITNGFSSFTTRGTTANRIDQKTLNFSKPDTGATLSPGDY